MHPVLLAQLAQERHVTLLRAAEAHRAAASLRTPSIRWRRARLLSVLARLSVGRRAVPAGHLPVAACCG